jgi:uncharacterized protein (TIGR00725 family)
VASTTSEWSSEAGRRFIVGVMGQGEDADEFSIVQALELGALIAREGWIVLSGGRDAGVMRAVNRGAKQVPGSLTLGILPTAEAAASPDLDIVVVTGMHNARNNINVLSSDVVVACGAAGAGTVSECALALKAGKPLVLLSPDVESAALFQKLGKERVHIADTPARVMAVLKGLCPG